MEHILLNSQTDYNSCEIVLNLQDVKILYNSCVDILNLHPEMNGYERVSKKLKMIIENYDK